MAIVLDGSGGITFPNSVGGTSQVQPASSKVLQVVQTQLTNLQTGSASAYAFFNVAGGSVSITPTSSTSKILVQYSCLVHTYTPAPYYGSYARILRNGTAVGVGTTGAGVLCGSWGYGTSSQYSSLLSQVFLDSPATTSTVTYQLQAGGESGVTAIGGSYGAANSGSGGGHPNLPTSIIVMEIAA